jgi:hypothetical protein
LRFVFLTLKKPSAACMLASSKRMPENHDAATFSLVRFSGARNSPTCQRRIHVAQTSTALIVIRVRM